MARIRISVKDLVQDIKTGVGRSELITKYGLSVRSLQGMVTLLLDSGKISRDELYGEFNQQGDTIFPDSFRGLTRYFVDFEIIVYEAGRPDVQGKLRDITEDGVGVIGLQANVDDVLTLVILGDAFGEVESFEFQGKCRWVNWDESSNAFASGFQIVDISEDDRIELRKFVRLVTFTD
ncbi:MAG: PilZ domain-containing protein [Desulfomonile tiedjei]|uniref:PilZ domain-containing protein n=1 Tax=Desulfomonile tiedjei TaxID=2358 RepID=A0A9D6UZX3_9BACT|nr:PilZ domain-containing protein [Desulfomonile tiedjei]